MAGLTEPTTATVQRLALGREGVPLVVVDDAHPTPDALRSAAHDGAFERSAGDYYPGVRAPVPPGYADWLAGMAATALDGADRQVHRASFAVALDAAADLAPIQRVPHIDTFDPDVVAAVHYLCEPPHAGTGFYRHRRTGYERIDPRRQAAWRQALNRDLRDHGVPDARYAGADDACFERIGGAALRFNRLILYPANCLHAGNLNDRTAAATGAADGRLTVTSLLRRLV